MRILALSDVSKWDGYEWLVDQWKPDVVILAGDLISDGVAAFWEEALELIPDFQRERHALYERVRQIRRRGKGCSICRNPVPPYGKWELIYHASCMFFDHVRQLKDYHRKTEAFAAVHQRIHVDKFYSFLEHAGKSAVVFVVKGDHDDDFAGAYNADRINKIPGCKEISGTTYRAWGEFFLGVSYQHTAYRRISRSLLAQFPQERGIVIAHARQRNVHLLADLRPKLIIRGHSGFGNHSIGGVPAVFTSGGYAIIEIGKVGRPRVRELHPPTPHISYGVEPYDTEPG